MPKVKTSSGAKKRIKVSAGGKLLRRHAMKRASSPGGLTKKSSKRKREIAKDQPVARADVKAVKKLLGRG